MSSKLDLIHRNQIDGIHPSMSKSLCQATRATTSTLFIWLVFGFIDQAGPLCPSASDAIGHHAGDPPCLCDDGIIYLKSGQMVGGSGMDVELRWKSFLIG